MSAQTLGLITGILFGVFLQQGRVLRFEKQVGALLFKDMTIVKFMLSAIVVGTIGINLLAAAGMIELDVKATHLGANIIGGCLFGVGWAIMGYCPGTSVGAVAEGRWHAIWAVLGMLLGAAIYAEVYPTMLATVLTWGNLGELTLPQLLGVSTWVVITVFAIAAVLLMRWFEKMEL